MTAQRKHQVYGMPPKRTNPTHSSPDTSFVGGTPSKEKYIVILIYNKGLI